MFQWLRDLFSSDPQTIEEMKEQAPRVSSCGEMMEKDIHFNLKHGGSFVVTDEDITVWKGLQNGIARLTVPANILVYISDGIHEKCRAERAIVEKLYLEQSLITHEPDIGVSKHDPSFTYEEGEIVTPEDEYSLDEEDCESGIHFFTDVHTAYDWSNCESLNVYRHARREAKAEVQYI